MLDNINRDLAKIMRCNKDNDIYQNTELFYNITSELVRLLPYKYNKKENILDPDRKCGILLIFNKDDYIVEKYNKILSYENFQKVLVDILTIRNKFIHEPHNISCAFSVGGTSMCSMVLCYKKKYLSISSISLSGIVNYLNVIFSKLQEEALKIVEKYEEYKEYPYYKILKDFDFRGDYYTVLPEYLMLGF